VTASAAASATAGFAFLHSMIFPLKPILSAVSHSETGKAWMRMSCRAEKESAQEAEPADGTLAAGFSGDLGTPKQGSRSGSITWKIIT
jgi:hypothetical protein